MRRHRPHGERVGVTGPVCNPTVKRSLDPLAIDRLPGTLQRYRHPSAAVERGPEELFVDKPHQGQVRLRLDGRRCYRNPYGETPTVD